MNNVLLSLSSLFEVLPDAVLVIDGSGQIVHANDRVTPTLGYLTDELIGKPLSVLIPTRYRARHQQEVALFHRHGHPIVMGSRPILHALHRSGIEVPLSISITNLNLDDERFSVAILRDATPMRNQLEENTALAELDPLTGLRNRLGLSRCIQAALQFKQPFALLFVDLAEFKPFNHRYGHKVGNEVLKLIARRLQLHTRRCDAAARFGGDEFVILLCDLGDPDLLARRATEIIAQLQKPFRLVGISGSVQVNVGGAIYPRDGATEEALWSLSDQNMYVAKSSGSHYFYRPHSESTSVNFT